MKYVDAHMMLWRSRRGRLVLAENMLLIIALGLTGKQMFRSWT
jgi:hypothetical protein